MKKLASWSVGLLLVGMIPGAFAASVPIQLQQGINYYNKGYINQALPLFQQAAEQNPQSEASQLWLARAYKKQGGADNFELAKAAYQNVININPNQVEALTALGEMLGWQPETRSQSIDLLERAARLSPNNPTIIKTLSETLTWENRFDEALHFVEPIATQPNANKDILAIYAGILSNTGHPEQSIDLYEQHLNASASKDPKLLKGYALALSKNGQKNQAKAVYEQVKVIVAEAPEESKSQMVASLASLAHDLGYFDEALSLDGSLPENLRSQNDVKLRVARTLAKSQRIPEAIDAFHQVYAAGQMTPQEKLEYADYLAALHLPKNSLPSPNLTETLYQEALQADPNNDSILSRIAQYDSLDPDKFEEAFGIYEKIFSRGTPSPEIKNQYLDFLKASKAHPEKAEGAFQALMQTAPGDTEVKAAYAEFLSWQEDKRSASLKIYLELAHEQPDKWVDSIEQVLQWHKPKLDMMPLYQDILSIYPNNRTASLSIARAYRDTPGHYSQALEAYQALMSAYPEDTAISQEWSALLVSEPTKRKEAAKVLKALVEKNPADLSVKGTYAKLLSYEHQFSQAMTLFNQILKEDPKNRDALIGKGYTLMWSGQKFQAKDFLQKARTLYPQDVDMAVALAEAEKSIGRYDRAFEIMREVKSKINSQSTEPSLFIYCEAVRNADGSAYQNFTYDYSILPYSNEPSVTTPQPAPVQTYSKPTVQPTSVTTAPSSNVQKPIQPIHRVPGKPLSPMEEMADDLEALHNSLTFVQAVQKESYKDLTHMHQSLTHIRERIPSVVSIHSDEETRVSTFAPSNDPNASQEEGALSSASDDMRLPLGQSALIDQQSNPLLSGGGYSSRSSNTKSLEDTLHTDLRPVFRAGYGYSVQDGEPTTTRMRTYGFPNQLSLMLTPQIQVRGGIVPRRYYQPRPTVWPNSTWGIQYTWGATAKLWDRLTLDGDMAITQFAQSDSTNLTYQASAKFDITDRIRLKLGGRRSPFETSLLAYTGLRPHAGPFAGDLIGQARENAFYAELNTNPTTNTDFNFGYEGAVVNGSNMPNNFKNQFFTSMGYTWHYSPNHSARVGYEFLYFGFRRNATNGFYDLSGSLSDPAVILKPVIAADPGYVFGGYYSPAAFFLNSIRLDLRGSFYDKRIEYKVGGSLGIQHARVGHGIAEPNPTTMASSFDGALILNWTDWFATYGNVEFLDAGGSYQRWRLGGGIILRPEAPALSPIIK